HLKGCCKISRANHFLALKRQLLSCTLTSSRYFPVEPLPQTGGQLMASLSGHYRVGVDIGGTFTDLVVFNDATGSFAIGKILTTPHDPSQAIETLLRETLEREGIATEDVQQLIHGTTLVTNAIIERTGSRTALLATQGFRDSIEIGRE